LRESKRGTEREKRAKVNKKKQSSGGLGDSRRLGKRENRVLALIYRKGLFSFSSRPSSLFFFSHTKSLSLPPCFSHLLPLPPALILTKGPETGAPSAAPGSFEARASSPRTRPGPRAWPEGARPGSREVRGREVPFSAGGERGASSPPSCRWSSLPPLLLLLLRRRRRRRLCRRRHRRHRHSRAR